MKLKNIYGKKICINGIYMNIDEIKDFPDSMKTNQGIKNLISQKYVEIVKSIKKDKQ